MDQRGFRMEQLGRYKKIDLMDRLRGDAPAGEGQGGFVRASDGIGLFFQRWLPEREPSLVLCCLHGMVSHGLPYGIAADGLVPHGAAVYAIDHRGHGLSGGAAGDVVSLRRMLADIQEFLDFVKKQHPDVPLFLLGESMGALFAINFAARRPEGIAGLILKAPPIKSTFVPDVVEIMRMPFYVASGLMDPRKPVIVATRQKNYVFKHPLNLEMDKKDPYRLKKFPPHLLFRLRDMQRYARDTAPGKLAMPSLVQQGGMDRTVDPAATQSFFNNIESKDKTLKIYPLGYHSMWTDPDCTDMIDELRKWLFERL